MNKTINTMVNNNRGEVIIAKTERNGLANFTGINMDVHQAMVRKTLRDTLYAWAPVYKVITIAGTDFEDNLVGYIQNVIGGNSPVMRAIATRKDENQNMQVAQYDEQGFCTFRTITTGLTNERIRYDFVDEVYLIKFYKLEEGAMGSMTPAEIVDSVISQGLTVNGNKFTLGKADEGVFINPLIWTPSNERNGQILFTSMDHNEAWNKLEAIGGGSISRKLAGKMPVAKFKKLASRLGLFATPAVEFANVGNAEHGLLVLDHELTGSDDFNAINKNILSKIGVEIDSNQWDGAAYFSVDLALNGLRNLGMKNIDAKKAIMFAFQLRVSQVYAKVFGEALHQSVINKMTKYIITELDRIGQETGKQLYRVYGNKNNISMILDSNAAKIVDLSFDTKEEGMTVYLLDIAKGSKSGTATQMTDKFALFDKEATAKFLNKRGYEDCIEYANSIGDNNCSILGEDINVWQTLLNIGKNMPADSKTSLDIFSDQYIMSRLLTDANTKHESAYRKGRVNIESMFERALFDATYLLTDGKIDSLLKVTANGAIECYSTDILEAYAEEIAAIESNESLTPEQISEELNNILTAGVIKYPTPGTEEIELVRFLTEKEVRRRTKEYVEAGIIDMNTAKILFNYFSFTSYGVIKIAADNALKHKLAGMDTDYDGVVVILERELVNILANVYAKRINALEESTGLIATHGGTIPFIDSSKDCVDVFSNEDDMIDFLYGDENNSSNIIGDTTTFADFFNN